MEYLLRMIATLIKIGFTIIGVIFIIGLAFGILIAA